MCIVQLKPQYSDIYDCISDGLNALNIITWLNEKTGGPPAKELKSVAEAEAFQDSNNCVVIGFYKVHIFCNLIIFLAVPMMTFLNYLMYSGYRW